LSKEDLKSLYFSKLKERYIPESNGAGIGLIDLARKIASPFVFDFHPVDDQKSFFSIHIIA